MKNGRHVFIIGTDCAGTVNGTMCRFYQMGPCTVTDAGSYLTATSPNYILVKINGRVNPSPIPGLPQDVFAIKPTSYTCYIRVDKALGEPSRKFQVKQFRLRWRTR